MLADDEPQGPEKPVGTVSIDIEFDEPPVRAPDPEKFEDQPALPKPGTPGAVPQN